MHIYVNITVYLPHSSYMFRCVIHHLQGGLLVFLLYETNIHRQHCKKNQEVLSRVALHEEGHAVTQLLEALRYKPEGRGIDSRWCHCNFSWT